MLYILQGTMFNAMIVFFCISSQLGISYCKEEIKAKLIYEKKAYNLRRICLVTGISDKDCNCQSIPYGIRKIRNDLCNDSLTGKKTLQRSKDEQSDKIYAIVVLVISIAGFILNLIIMLPYYYMKEVRNYKFIIIQSVFYQIIFSIFSSTVFFYFLWADIKIPGECKLVYFVVTVGIHLPISFMLPLMLDRFFSVCYTFDIFTRWRIKMFILIHISTSIIIKIPSISVNENPCCIYLTGDHLAIGYNVIVFSYHMVLPVLVIAILYAKTTRTLNNQTRVCVDRYTVRSMRIIGNKRILKIIISMVFNFILSVLPSLLLLFTDGNGRLSRKLCLILSLSFLVTNPLVYIARDRLYRRHIALILKKIITATQHLWIIKVLDKMNEVIHFGENDDKVSLLTPKRNLKGILAL